ncbi:MAG: hypothetical protein WCA04_09785 [Geobacteraceae bacterium]
MKTDSSPYIINTTPTRTVATPRWRVFRQAYPRIAVAIALGCAVLCLIDIVLVGTWIVNSRELAHLRTSIPRTEGLQAAAIKDAEKSTMALTAELVRREALGSKKLHLVVYSGKKLMSLEREGAALREMHVRQGPETIKGAQEDTAGPARRHVVRVVDDTYRWSVPESAFIHSGEPVPKNRMLRGALGPVAIILDDGTVIYSKPATGPLSDASFVPPGTIRVKAADLEAIKANLQPGMAVYFL